VDVVTGLTFAKAALDSRDEDKKLRNQKSARKAYDTIVRMLNKITPTDADARQLHESLQQLKSHLIQLGETF
jgi:DNA invertase Pin-like site-specific DNA recombinase